MVWIARAGVVSGVLLLSAISGYTRPLLVLAALFGMGSLLIFMRSPALGITLTVLGGFAVPFHGPSGFNLTMAGIGLLLGLWLLEIIIDKRQVALVASRTVRPMMVLVILTTLSLVVGQLSWYLTDHAPLGAQLGGLALLVLSVGAFLLVGNRVSSLLWLQVITYSYIAYSSLYIAGFYVGAIGRVVNRFFQWGSTSGSLFWLWLVTLAFSQAAFNRRLHPLWRGGLALITLLTVIMVFVYQSDWKSGWIPPLVSIAAMLAARSWGFVVALGVIGTAPALQIAANAIASDEYSYSTRVDAYAIVIEIAKANPVLGLGPANYYWYTPLFPIRGYSVQFNSHSQYVDLFAQFGVLGLLCFLWCFWEIGKLGWQLRTQAPDGFARAYVYGALGGIVGTLTAGVLGDWIVPFFYNVGMNGFRSSVLSWLFLGGLVLIARLQPDSVTRPDGTNETEKIGG
jgi:hypothetical protein